MKKTLTVAIAVIVLLTLGILMVACTNGGEVTVKSYEIAETSVKVGDTYNASAISVKATLSDDTTKNVTNNLILAEEDVEKLLLDEDNKYTKAGVYTIRVYHLEEREEFFVGEWKITVKAVK